MGRGKNETEKKVRSVNVSLIGQLVGQEKTEIREERVKRTTGGARGQTSKRSTPHALYKWIDINYKVHRQTGHNLKGTHLLVQQNELNATNARTTNWLNMTKSIMNDLWC